MAPGSAADRNEVTGPSKSYVPPSVNIIHFSESGDFRLF